MNCNMYPGKFVIYKCSDCMYNTTFPELVSGGQSLELYSS